MRVLAACSLGGAGHLRPLLPFLSAARTHGHDTLVVGPPALRSMVEEAGYGFRAGGEPPESAVAPIRERLPTAPPDEASRLGNRELFGRLAATAMLPGVEEACSTWGPDIVLRDPCEYASAVVGGGRGIPTAQVAISVASGEAASIAVAAPALEEHRRGLVDELMASPYLTRFPTSLDPSPFPTTIRFSERPEHPLTPVPQWWPERPRRPLVYLTFGTVLGYMSIAEDVFRTALSAVADLDVRVLLTVGHRVEGSTLSPIPANVHVEPWVDQDAVLAEADLVVCHGGSGTVFGALGAGIPVVCVPLFADQFENASRVAKVGAGVTVLSSKAGPGATREVIEAGDAPRIARAIETVLDTAAYRESAGRVEAEMAATAPVEDVLDGLLARRPPGRSPRADATPSPGPR